MGFNLNGKRLLAIVGAILSALVAATAQLTHLFGEGVAQDIISAAALGNLILQSVSVALSGDLSQDAQVKQVLAMPGVERLRINRLASPKLAALALDPAVDKISPTDEDRILVAATATAAPKT